MKGKNARYRICGTKALARRLVSPGTSAYSVTNGGASCDMMNETDHRALRKRRQCFARVTTRRFDRGSAAETGGQEDRQLLGDDVARH